MGAGFRDYMHIGAALARYCPMTALTLNMHTQTVLWTGVIADDLTMTDEERTRHEAIRAALYALDRRGRRDPGAAVVRGHREGRDGGRDDACDARRRRLPGLGAQDLRLAGGRGRRLQPDLRGAGRGPPAVPLGARPTTPACRSSATGTRSACAAPTPATWCSTTPSCRRSRELLPAGFFGQIADRWPYVYMTLTPAYVGLTDAVVDFVQEYLAGAGRPGSTARRDSAAEAVGLGRDPDAGRRSRAHLGADGGGGRGRPDARPAAPRAGVDLHGDGDRAGGRREGDPRLRRRRRS